MPVTINGINGVTFNDATTQNSAGTLSNASAGYVKLPNGLIIQWGVTAQTSGSNSSSFYLTTSYPLAFPNAVRQVIVSTFNPTELNNAISNNLISFDNSTFVTLTQRFGGSAPRASASFIAIGY
jgi:hypothetical protein